MVSFNGGLYLVKFLYYAVKFQQRKRLLKRK